MRQALAAAVVLASGVAQAAPSARAELDAGAASFRSHDCSSAMPHLTYVLYPDEKLADREDLFIAHAMLGACNIDSQNPDEGKTEFRRALELVPDKELDPLFFSATAVHSFDEVKADLVAQAKRDAEVREAQRQKEELARRVANLRYVEKNSYPLVFVPFGVGQFQNGDFKKGLAFGVIEIGLATTSAVIWYSLVSEYGLSSNRVPVGDAKHVLHLQEAELATGIAFFGVYLIGMYDALRHFKKQRELPGSEEILRDLDSDKPTKKPPPKPKTSMHFGPIVLPNGAGIGLSWETH